MSKPAVDVITMLALPLVVFLIGDERSATRHAAAVFFVGSSLFLVGLVAIIGRHALRSVEPFQMNDHL
ncbi:MAG: hypothetical protein ACREV3_14425 [Gammaproteobacteria bacterium]